MNTKFISVIAILSLLAFSTAIVVNASTQKTNTNGIPNSAGILLFVSRNGYEYTWDILINKTNTVSTFYVYPVIYYSNDSQITLPTGHYHYCVTLPSNYGYGRDCFASGNVYLKSNGTVVNVTFP